MNGTRYDIPAISDKELAFMHAQAAHDQRQLEYQRQQENACPVCGNKAGPRSRTDIVKCVCGAIY